MDRHYRISRRKPSIFSYFSVTSVLIFINVLFYFISLIIFSLYGQDFFYENFALTPSLVLDGKSIWTFVTSIFMHAGFFHLFVNMLSLFFIGNFLEKIIGGKRFLWLYLLSGLVGGIFFVLSGLIFNNDIPGVGASGAIFGVLGVLSILTPKSKIYLIVGPIILILVEAILSPNLPSQFLPVFGIIINTLFFIMIFSLISFNPKLRKFSVPVELSMWLLPIVAIVPLVIIDFFVDLPIGNSAHIGGLVMGLIYGFYLKKKFPNKTKMISNIFSR